MLIECLIQRDGGTFVEIGDRPYHFTANENGAHVAHVEREDDVAAFLRWPDAYRPYMKGAVRRPVAPASAPREEFVRTELPAGAPSNLDQMTREQLLVYAANIGMRKPHPSISDEKLRLNIAVFLDERSEQVVPDDEDVGGDEADE